MNISYPEDGIKYNSDGLDDWSQVIFFYEVYIELLLEVSMK